MSIVPPGDHGRWAILAECKTCGRLLRITKRGTETISKEVSIGKLVDGLTKWKAAVFWKPEAGQGIEVQILSDKTRHR